MTDPGDGGIMIHEPDDEIQRTPFEYAASGRIVLKDGNRRCAVAEESGRPRSPEAAALIIVLERDADLFADADAAELSDESQGTSSNRGIISKQLLHSRAEIGAMERTGDDADQPPE